MAQRHEHGGERGKAAGQDSGKPKSMPGTLPPEGILGKKHRHGRSEEATHQPSLFWKKQIFSTMSSKWTELEAAAIKAHGREICALLPRERHYYELELYKYCESQKIGPEHADYFIDRKRNVYNRKVIPDTSKGQMPCMDALGSDPRLNLADVWLRGGKVKVIDGYEIGGVFATVIKLTSQEGLAATSDVTARAYQRNLLSRLEGLSKKGDAPKFSIVDDTAPFIPSCGVFDAKNEKGGRSFEDVARLEIARLREFVEKAKKKDHVFSTMDGTGLQVWQSRGDKVLLMPVVFEVVGQGGSEFLKPFVVWEENGSIAKKEFERFVDLFMKSRFPVNNHKVDLFKESLHDLAEDPYYVPLMRMKGRSMVCCCVDSRDGMWTSSAVEKLIGAYPSKKQMEHTLENEELKELRIYVHAPCGYLHVAADISEMLEALGEIAKSGDPKKTRMLGEVYQELWRVVHGQKEMGWSEDFAAQLAERLELPNTHEEKDTFLRVFCGIKENNNAKDHQQTLKHFWDRGLIKAKIVDASGKNQVVSNGNSDSVAAPFIEEFYVPAVQNVKTFLSDNKITRYKNERDYLIAEEIARALVEQAAQMPQVVSGEKTVKVFIKAEWNSSLYHLPNKLTVANANNMERVMVSESMEEGAENVANRGSEDVFKRSSARETEFNALY